MNECEKAQTKEPATERKHPDWDYAVNRWKVCPHCCERHNPTSPCP